MGHTKCIQMRYHQPHHNVICIYIYYADEIPFGSIVWKAYTHKPGTDDVCEHIMPIIVFDARASTWYIPYNLHANEFHSMNGCRIRICCGAAERQNTAQHVPCRRVERVANAGKASENRDARSLEVRRTKCACCMMMRAGNSVLWNLYSECLCVSMPNRGFAF